MAEDTQYSTNDSADPATDSANDASVRRADELFDQAGQRLGAFAAQARLRLQALAAQSAQAAQGAANRTAQAMNHITTDDGQTNQAGARSASGAAPEPMARAEELVDQAGQRLSALGQATNQRLQVLFAHLKEEGEDIWADAQNIRRQDTHIH